MHVLLGLRNSAILTHFQSDTDFGLSTLIVSDRLEGNEQQCPEGVLGVNRRDQITPAVCCQYRGEDEQREMVVFVYNTNTEHAGD